MTAKELRDKLKDIPDNSPILLEIYNNTIQPMIAMKTRAEKAVHVEALDVNCFVILGCIG